MRIPFFESLNPTGKSLAIIVSCVLMAVGADWRINAAVILGCLLCLVFLSRCDLRVLAGLYAPLIFLAGAIFLSNLASARLDAGSQAIYEMASFDTALLLATRILSYASFGILFGLTTQNKEFAMSLMQQLHIKPKFAYGVLAALHLVPTLRREWDEVCLAYAVRGRKKGLFPFGPLFNTLVGGIRWSENVAMAMESKGFDGDGERTFALETPVRKRDLAAGIAMVLIMVVFLILWK